MFLGAVQMQSGCHFWYIFLSGIDKFFALIRIVDQRDHHNIYRQSLVKKPTSKNTSSNNTFPFWQYHRNIEINITYNRHLAFVYLLG